MLAQRARNGPLEHKSASDPIMRTNHLLSNALKTPENTRFFLGGSVSKITLTKNAIQHTFLIRQQKKMHFFSKKPLCR